MPPKGAAVATGLMGALVWLAADELLWPARIMLVVLLVPLPVIAIAQARAFLNLQPPFPRLSLYASTGFALWILAGLTAAAAGASGFTPTLMGLRMVPLAVWLMWCGAALLGAATLFLVGRWLGVRDPPALRELLPRTRRERIAFFALAITAGICEELVFRGFLIPALGAATGSLWAGVVISATLFGLLHVYQATPGVVRAGLLGLLLSLPLLVSGSILPAMAAHTLIDIVGGLVLGDKLVD